MSRLTEMAREDGWALAVSRALVSVWRKRRDGLLARRLGAEGFRAGRAPKLMGLAHMRVGAGFSAGDALWMEAVVSYGGQRFAPELVVGAGVSVSDRVHIACLRRVVIGDGMLAGSGVLISDHTHGVYAGEAQSAPEERPVERRLWSAGEIVIGRNVWLGDGVVVLAGTKIGDGVVVGANSVVRGELPAGTMAVGAPARVVRRWDEARREWMRVERAENV